jgi:hypothetical protein
MMLKIMYGFFKVTASLETASLPAWRRCMVKNRFREVESKEFYRGFIHSSIFKKTA